MSERVMFSRSLYAGDAVRAAAAAYASVADVRVRDADEEIEAVFAEPPEEDLVHAFCNHALFETIVQRRRQSVQDVS